MSESVSLLCSKRETARLLGIGRGTTLDDLIRRGVLRPVVIAGRVVIPRAQIDALAERGEAPAGCSGARPSKVRRGGAATTADVEI